MYQSALSATMCAWFFGFFENAFVSRVNRRIAIRIVRFARSAYDVPMCFGSGLPVILAPARYQKVALFGRVYYRVPEYADRQK